MEGFRRTVRRLRFFYKPDCRELYREHMADYVRTLLFPFVGGGRAIFKDATEVRIPRPYFDMLATCCRLRAIGARPAWREGDMEVEYRGYRFHGPPDTKLMPLSLRGFLVEDVWRTGGTDLSGKTVIDIGAHIGVFAVACAKRGALVHAFEPFPVFQEYIRKNAAANGVRNLVVVHGVGLSDCDRLIDEATALAEIASSSHGGGRMGRKGADNLFRKCRRLSKEPFHRQGAFPQDELRGVRVRPAGRRAVPRSPPARTDSSGIPSRRETDRRHPASEGLHRRLGGRLPGTAGTCKGSDVRPPVIR